PAADARRAPSLRGPPRAGQERERSAIPRMSHAMRTSRIPALALPLLLVVAFAACHILPGAPDEVAPITLVPEVMGDHLAVSTRSHEAQSFFDQGLSLYWGFDHEEAQRSFARAAEFDPSLALAYWGMALAAGPNINNPTMDDERNQAAFGALEKARAHEGTATPLERELIEAL